MTSILANTDSECEETLTVVRPRGLGVSKPVLSLGALALVGAAVRLTWGGRTINVIAADSLEGKAATWAPAFPSQCGKTEVDVEYVDEVSGWGINYDHIPTPEMCCAMCQGVKKCKAYTWVKNAGLDGCPSQCWLKGGTGSPRTKPGLVSGLPPPRKELGVVPAGPKNGATTLFCFSLMVPGTEEQNLLSWQHQNKVSIFACEGSAIYSSKHIEVAPGLSTTVIDSDLKCGYGGDSQSALNAWIFIALFDKLLDDQLYANFAWSVKADPDAVFFPHRLRALLPEHEGAGYLNNCKYGMHGPIEVFSKRAMDALAADYEKSWDGKSPSSCVKHLNFGQWGEDMFLDQCLSKILHVAPKPLEPRLMCEAHCDCPAWYWCTNGTDRVSFHPFKTVDAYATCMGNSLGAPEQGIFLS